MTLCWSLDKLGPMTQSVEDAMLVLRAILDRTPAIRRACRAASSLMPPPQSPASRLATSRSG
jgi:Asp-tRNA(Asn)/Glu-tRNA(Gln) amidotransferase A subunit family amidase